MTVRNLELDSKIRAYSPSRDEILDAVYKGKHATIIGFSYILFEGDVQWSIIDDKYIQ